MWKPILLWTIPLYTVCTPPQESNIPFQKIEKHNTETKASTALPKEPTKTYPEILKDIKAKKMALKKVYLNQTIKKDSCIKASRTFLLKQFSNEIFPSWYGTEWDFNGMTRTPKKGKIACGYFVTTTLQDAGFNIPRIKWAQQISEHYIKRLAPDDIHRFSNKPLEEITSNMKLRGDGLYIVGLDSHVGFILVEDGHPLFIHSDYYEPYIGVMAEELNSDNPLKDSKYRVIGKIFSDDMIVNWLTGKVYRF